MKILDSSGLTDFLATVDREFNLTLPVIDASGCRIYGTLQAGTPALHGGALLAKPTSLFFPQEEDVHVEGGGDSEPPPEKQLLAIGFTPKDLLCLGFIDRFFSDGFRDDIYFRRRQGALIAAVSGYVGADGGFIPPAFGNCDFEFIFDGKNWIINPYSEAGRGIAALIPYDAPIDALSQVMAEVERYVDEDAAIIKKASQILMADLVPDSFWEEIAASCILCTGCNLVCPTCTCFGVRDWRDADGFSRSRMWDSCQLDGFAREAGGHNPLGTEALRTRRRIHHKLAADMTKWGEMGCFTCGRCDAVCPTGIGIVAVARKMVERFQHNLS
ncbi:MAG: 4Fe-4S dicluster domain-containing protein [Geobacteraceae bacterium]|nr:4Fe-4S dicluster domain-containing protein [Geobacteraceae bacterium]